MYGDSYDRWAAAGDDESIKKWIEDTGLTPEENYKVRAFDPSHLDACPHLLGGGVVWIVIALSLRG